MNVFSFTVNDEAEVTSSGRPFHSFGPAEANDRSPIVTWPDGRTASWLGVDDRSRLSDGVSATRLSWSDGYRRTQSREKLGRRQFELSSLGST